MDRKRKLEVSEQDAVKRFHAANGAIAMPGQSTLNPYTGRPYSARYYEILSKRKGRLDLKLSDCPAVTSGSQRIVVAVSMQDSLYGKPRQTLSRC